MTASVFSSLKVMVKSSLLQNGLWANACAVQTRLFGEHVAHRPLREEAPNALANHYRTRTYPVL